MKPKNTRLFFFWFFLFYLFFFRGQKVYCNEFVCLRLIHQAALVNIYTLCWAQFPFHCVLMGFNLYVFPCPPSTVFPHPSYLISIVSCALVQKHRHSRLPIWTRFQFRCQLVRPVILSIFSLSLLLCTYNERIGDAVVLYVGLYALPHNWRSNCLFQVFCFFFFQFPFLFL